jgi:hypothetical protein
MNKRTEGETHWQGNRGNYDEFHDRGDRHRQHKNAKRDQDRLMNDVDSETLATIDLAVGPARLNRSRKYWRR